MNDGINFSFFPTYSFTKIRRSEPESFHVCGEDLKGRWVGRLSGLSDSFQRRKGIRVRRICLDEEEEEEEEGERMLRRCWRDVGGGGLEVEFISPSSSSSSTFFLPCVCVVREESRLFGNWRRALGGEEEDEEEEAERRGDEGVGKDVEEGEVIGGRRGGMGE